MTTMTTGTLNARQHEAAFTLAINNELANYSLDITGVADNDLIVSVVSDGRRNSDAVNYCKGAFCEQIKFCGDFGALIRLVYCYDVPDLSYQVLETRTQRKRVQVFGRSANRDHAVNMSLILCRVFGYRYDEVRCAIDVQYLSQLCADVERLGYNSRKYDNSPRFAAMSVVE